MKANKDPRTGTFLLPAGYEQLWILGVKESYKDLTYLQENYAPCRA